MSDQPKKTAGGMLLPREPKESKPKPKPKKADEKEK